MAGVTDPIRAAFALLERGVAPDSEEIAISVDGVPWTEWDELEITLTLDACSKFEFTAPFRWQDRAFRETFRPLSFAPITVSSFGEVVLTGTMMDVEPRRTTMVADVSVKGYGAPGVLADCQLPPDLIPVELTGLTLKQACERLVEPFGLEVQYDAEPAVLGDVRAEPTDKVLALLAKCCRPVGAVLADTADGKLWVRSTKDPAKYRQPLREGERPLESIEVKFSPQSVFSSITCLQTVSGRSATETEPTRQPEPKWSALFDDGDAGAMSDEAFTEDLGGAAPAPQVSSPRPKRRATPVAAAKRRKPPPAVASGARLTLVNPHVSALVVRPLVYQLEDGAQGGEYAIDNSVEAKLARMMGLAATWTAFVATWRAPSGEIWSPGKLLTLTAPGAMIYRPTALLIREVRLHRGRDSESAELELVFPGAFGGSLPASLPWDV